MGNNKKLFVILELLIISVCSIIGIYIFITNISYTHANDIFNMNMSSILELKCESADIGESYGTAEVITSEYKLITNAHVITYNSSSGTELFENCSVRSVTEDTYNAVKVVKYDIQKDLALLEFVEYTNDMKYAPIEVGNSEKIHYGDTVYAMGNGQNFGISISSGIVSIPSIIIEYDSNFKNVIQSDLTITSGNSGGALLDENGVLIGITTFRVKDNSGNVVYGICYSIPINDVLLFINE